MKNFVFISPNFPLTYWKFCRELKYNGSAFWASATAPMMS